MDATIAPLWGHRELAPLLARWHHDEFGYLYDARIWNHEIAVLELEAMAEPGSRDVTWIAFDGATADEGSMLGSVSLIGSDDLPGFEDLGPWLASLYVTPSARSAGLGGRLVECVMTEAAARGHDYVHLFTAGQDAYYLARGWRTIAEVDHRGERAVVMAKATSARGVRRAVSSHWCSDPDSRRVLVSPRRRHTAAQGAPDGRDPPRTVVRRRSDLGRLPSDDARGLVLRRARRRRRDRGRRRRRDRRRGRHGGAGRRPPSGRGRARRHRCGGAGRAGGRVATDTTLDIPLPLGAAWMHGDIGHPLSGLVSSYSEEWGVGLQFVAGHGLLSDAVHEQAASVRAAVHDQLVAAPPDVTAERALAEALAARSHLDPLVRAVVAAWITVEVENLYGAPMDDFAPSVGIEPYELPGDDCFITSSLAPVIASLAAGLDIVYGERIHELTLGNGMWSTDTGRSATTVIVTVPVAVLAADAIAFSPGLPEDVLESLSLLGTGPITKLFATYDTRWWPTARRPIRLVGSELLQAVDMSELTKVPVLCWFATGDTAREIEAMTEHELCVLVDRATRECGLMNWDA